MKQGRIVWNGGIHHVRPGPDGTVVLADGRQLSEQDVQWLPPVEPRTVFALGLNYADHARELDFTPPSEPVAFIKPAGTVIGHRTITRRPADVTFMHYECELAVVIGKTAYRVSKADALDYVAGYTVANDYAIRDYLENYYRPNLRVKGRDNCTPMGPWLVSRDAIRDPGNLRLQTRVNGVVTQEGTTADLIFDVPTLIEWLSSFMTLSPGDVILTGTPKGSVDVKAGDVVETEVEGLGILVNTIVSDEQYFASKQ
ncbi:fumarylacetoacetate hydrolase family protein [Alcaligenes endophyticus]|uniref:Fumarylacetoacetate hydrolase family protein n=1 Tax=Alcaligenes endophyticus TaxID=1929088 RepID=A0ABT8EMK5_9BURK|nr:fumarylacetoacetate hydrolase family protein [Alcaligenes endophyticus]MCX5591013.1 fumarylacetoacetate hydrolase family protein [Alcaligenes endophyticus]MDN4122410.1 fumarylacetoacetate hydrolase family protein [Alcaligenes endophyticus]